MNEMQLEAEKKRIKALIKQKKKEITSLQERLFNLETVKCRPSK